MPTRKLMRVTIGSAWGPFCCMKRNRSTARKRTFTSRSLRKVNDICPRKLSVSVNGRDSANSALANAFEKWIATNSLRAPFFSGTASASSTSRRSPFGSLPRSTGMPFRGKARMTWSETKPRYCPNRPALEYQTELTWHEEGTLFPS